MKLISFYPHIQLISTLREGIPAQEAIFQGCRLQLHPVLMIPLITILSLTALLFPQGSRSEIQRPLAVVVAGGLKASTFLTLFVLPELFRFFVEKRKAN